MEIPPNIPEIFTPHTEQARGIVDRTLSEGRIWLTDTEAKAVLAAYKIPVAETYASATGLDGLESPVLAKVNRLSTWKLVIGVRDDVQFGPVILFGQGGTAVEIIQDKAIVLPPLNMHLVREVMSRTRICRLLEGYGDRPAADMNGIALTLVKVSHLISDISDIVELEINPLLADEQGVLVLNAHIKVIKSYLPGTQRLSIRPYPKEFEKTLTLPDGQTLMLRPIRQEDEPAFQSLFSRLSQDEIRLRFLHSMKYLSHNMAVRMMINPVMLEPVLLSKSKWRPSLLMARCINGMSDGLFVIAMPTRIDRRNLFMINWIKLWVNLTYSNPNLKTQQIRFEQKLTPF